MGASREHAGATEEGLEPHDLPGPEVPGSAATRLAKRSVVVAGHRTSVSLEEAFWQALKGEAAARGLSLNALITKIDAQRSGNLSAALRVFCLEAAQGRRR